MLYVKKYGYFDVRLDSKSKESQSRKRDLIDLILMRVV